MGIPYYFYNIYKKYNEDDLIIDEYQIKNMKNISYLFFDYNSLIHPCSQIDFQTDNWDDEVILNTIIYTRYIISIIGAKEVYIMIDGIPPMGKMIQQRERRYKSYFLKKNSKDEFWDSNCISPGTKFMKKLRVELDKLSDELKNIHISDSLEVGEGEHKITKILNTLNASEQGNDGKVIIYGLDADLIMLSLMNKQSDKIILVRDNKQTNTFNYVDISKLKRCIYKDISLELKFNSDINRIIQDYIFICFLVGNDFIGNIPSLTIKDNGINVVIKCYIKTINKYKNYIIKNGDTQNAFEDKVNKDILVDFIGELSNLEDYYYKKIYKYTEYKDDLPKNESIYYYTDNYIDFSKSPNEYKRAYYLYYNNSCSKKNIDDYCKEWLKTIYWIYGYYNNHSHCNWNYYYKYKESPFISDIYNYLKKTEFKFEKIVEDKPIDIKEQLLFILPEESLKKELIKEENDKLDVFLRIEENIHKIPNKIYIDVTNKKWLWESKVI
jgi:5'-3' exonuclease